MINLGCCFGVCRLTDGTVVGTCVCGPEGRGGWVVRRIVQRLCCGSTLRIVPDAYTCKCNDPPESTGSVPPKATIPGPMTIADTLADAHYHGDGQTLGGPHWPPQSTPMCSRRFERDASTSRSYRRTGVRPKNRCWWCHTGLSTRTRASPGSPTLSSAPSTCAAATDRRCTSPRVASRSIYSKINCK